MRILQSTVAAAVRARAVEPLDSGDGSSLSQVIERLVGQVEERFGELERQMSDPGVIADRERYAAVGRE